jgi:hypothetical protein
MVAVLYPVLATTDYLVDTRLHEIGLPSEDTIAASDGDNKSRMITTSVTHDKVTGEVAEFHDQAVSEEEKTSCASRWCDNSSLSLKLRMCDAFVNFMTRFHMAEEDHVDRSSYSELSGGDENDLGASSAGDSSLDSIDLK